MPVALESDMINARTNLLAKKRAILNFFFTETQGNDEGIQEDQHSECISIILENEKNLEASFTVLLFMKVHTKN